MPHTHDEGNAGDLGNQLFTSLTADVSVPAAPDFSDPKFTYTADPNSPLYDDVADLTVADVTDTTVDGSGAFDQMMKAVDAHLAQEFKNNRITGDQYARVYAEVMGGVLTNATQFVLSRDQAKWQAIAAQMQARIAEIQATGQLLDLEKIKADAIRSIFEMQNSGAAYALTKMKLSTEDAQHCNVRRDNEIKDYELENLLPVRLNQEQFALMQRLPAELALIKEKLETERANTMDLRSDNLTPVSGAVGKTKENLQKDIDTKQYTLDVQLPKQVDLINTQISLAEEQVESERAKTLDTRTDGAVIEGSIGKQKDLYDQQIDSFVKDAQHKTAKMYLDSWITQKTLDEGLTAPAQLTNTNIDAVLAEIRNLNNL